jgi:prophage maintenance system killer protein
MIASPGQALLLAIHDEQLARFGGTPGLANPSVLDGLLDRCAARETAALALTDTDDVPALAAACTLDIIADRPFLGGNLPTAFAVLCTLLALNDFAFEPPAVEAALTLLAAASGDIDATVFIAWVRRSARLAAPATALHQPPVVHALA